jgi:hypothetical protein
MKRHDEAKDKRKQMFMSLFIVAIMSLSVLGYMIGKDSNDSSKYNGFSFIKTQKGWKTEANNKEIFFGYHPSQVSNINISKEIIQKINNSFQIYTTSDENSLNKQSIALSQFEFSNIMQDYNKYTVIAFTDQNNFNKPIITCANATSFVPVIMFEKYNQTEVTESGNCIYFRSRSDADFIALKDRVLYGVLGIIN